MSTNYVYGTGRRKTAVARVYRRYRERANAPDDVTWRSGLSFVYEPTSADPIPVHFIGVWDTVGALGIPDHLDLFDTLDRSYHQFHSVELHPQIRHARHAVALDEERDLSQRKLRLPPFHGQSVRRYTQVMTEATSRERQRVPGGGREGDASSASGAGRRGAEANSRDGDRRLPPELSMSHLVHDE